MIKLSALYEIIEIGGIEPLAGRDTDEGELAVFAVVVNRLYCDGEALGDLATGEKGSGIQFRSPR